MVRNPEVLEMGFQPQEIPHREGDIDHLTSILKPVCDDHRVDGAFIHGPPGAGKTCTAKFLIDRLD